MKHWIFYFLILGSFSTTLKGQAELKFGLSSGAQMDILETFDQGKHFSPTIYTLSDLRYGGFLRYNSPYFGDYAISFTKLAFTMSMGNDIKNNWSVYAREGYEFSLKYRRGVPIGRSKFGVGLEYQLCFTQEKLRSSLTESGNFNFETELGQIEASYTRLPSRKNHSNVGLSLFYTNKITNKIGIDLDAVWSQGLQQQYLVDIHYDINSSTDNYALAVSRGSYFAFNFALTYDLSGIIGEQDLGDNPFIKKKRKNKRF